MADFNSLFASFNFNYNSTGSVEKENSSFTDESK